MSVKERLAVVLKDREFFGPVSEDVVCLAERELGVSFPTSYREFLRLYGAAFLYYEIAGIPNTRASDDVPPYWPNVIDKTLMTRRATRGHLPDAYIPISGDGGDYVFYLDTSARGESGECPVIVLGPGADGVEAACSFVDWIEKCEVGQGFPDVE